MATTPESFVDALKLAFGKQTTQRAAHSKGVVLLGKFKHEGAGHRQLLGQLGHTKMADADPRGVVS
jgi:hypothetical protein